MVKPLHFRIYIGLFFFFCTLGSSVQAISRFFVPAGASGVWSNPANWSPAGIPSGSDVLTISSSKNCILDVPLSVSGSITIDAGASLTIEQSFSLLSAGTLFINPTGLFDASGQSLIFNGNGTINGTIKVNASTDVTFIGRTGTMPSFNQSVIRNLLINSLSTITMGADLHISGLLIVSNNSTLSVSGNKLSIPSSVISLPGFIGNILFSTGVSGSEIELIGNGNITLPSLALKSIIFNNIGTVTMGGSLEIADQIQIGASTVFLGLNNSFSIVPFTGSSITIQNNNQFSSSLSSINFGLNGSFINNGTFNLSGGMNCSGSFANNGTVNFPGSANLTVNGSFSGSPTSEFNPLHTNPTLNLTVSPTGTWFNAGLFNTGTAASLIISSNAINAFNNSGTLNLRSNLTISGGSGSIVNTGQITSSTGRGFQFSGTGNPILNLTKSIEIEQLIVNKTSGSVALAGPEALKITDQISVLAGQLDLAGQPVTLRSTASKTARIAQIIGTLSGATNVTTERYIQGTNSGWYFLGTSVSGQSFSDWTDDFEIRGPFPEATLNTEPERSTVFEFNGTVSPSGPTSVEVNGWRVPSSAAIQTGKGYRTFLKSTFFGGTQTVDNTGSVVQGFVDFNPDFNALGYSGGGWNFLSNPYPSQIDWNSAGWSKSNIGSAIYVWNGQTGQYGAYNFANDPPGSNPGTNGVSNTLASGQAFFVKATGPTPTLTSAESVKSGVGASFIRQSANPSSMMRISLTNAFGYTDENVIRFHESGSISFDPENDALKLTGGILNLSTRTPEGVKLCINTLPAVPEEGMVIPIGVSSFVNGAFQLRFSDLGDEAGSARIRLFDAYTNSFQAVNEGFVYRFTISSDTNSSKEGRFQLVMSKTIEFPVLAKEEETTLHVGQNSGSDQINVTIRNRKPGKGEIRMTDMTGKIIFGKELENNGQSEYRIPLHVARGIYLLDLKQDKSSIKTKVILGN